MPIVVEALTAHRNVALLAEQARALGAKLAVVADPAGYARAEGRARRHRDRGGAPAPRRWSRRRSGRPTGSWPASSAPPGWSRPWPRSRRGAIVAFANKECLVCAGASDHATRCATAAPRCCRSTASTTRSSSASISSGATAIDEIMLTASGGPFREPSRDDDGAPPRRRRRWRTRWRMGAKISVDSATMMNKGLELIEAHTCSRCREERSTSLVHPQSIIHSLVDLSSTARCWPSSARPTCARRSPMRSAGRGGSPAPAPRLDLCSVGRLTFEPPDPALSRRCAWPAQPCRRAAALRPF